MAINLSSWYIKKVQQKWTEIKINNPYFINHIVDDSLGSINVTVVRQLCKHELELLSDTLELIFKDGNAYDYINMEHQGIYAAGCKNICKGFLNMTWTPKILNLSYNKILQDVLEYPEVHQFLKLDSVAWVDLTGNYCMGEKECVQNIESELLLKVIFIPEEQLDKGLWRLLFRDKENPIESGCNRLESAILESHKKYYNVLKTIKTTQLQKNNIKRTNSSSF